MSNLYEYISLLVMSGDFFMGDDCLLKVNDDNFG